MQPEPILDAADLLRYFVRILRAASGPDTKEFAVDYVMKQPYPLLSFRGSDSVQPFRHDLLEEFVQEHLIFVTWRNRNGQIGTFYPTAEALRRGGDTVPKIVLP